MVKDKINYRTRGPRTALTRQTVQGRANDGGLRIGEMERDAVIGHGLNHFLNESHMVRGDEYYMAICNNTGTVAIYNEDRNLFLSPGADGPIKFTTAVDDTMNIENVSRYGRSFSIIRIPYTFKLLMQELGTMNVSMRIITEDNVDQLYNMSYSKNAEVLNATENASKTRVPLVTEFKYPKSVSTPSPIRAPITPEDSPIRESPETRERRMRMEERMRRDESPEREKIDYSNRYVPQEEGDAYEEIYRAQHPEEFDADGNWLYAEATPEIEKLGPRTPTETPPPLEQEENITMDVKDSPQILTAVSKEPVLAQPKPDVPSPEFYIPSDIVDSPEKREAFLEMRRKEEEERKNNPESPLYTTGGGLSMLTDVATEESDETNDSSADSGEKKFVINN